MARDDEVERVTILVRGDVFDALLSREGSDVVEGTDRAFLVPDQVDRSAYQLMLAVPDPWQRTSFGAPRR